MDVITDKEKIRKAICATKGMPDQFLPKKLEPVEYGTYKGDNLPSNWSCNSFFTIGEKYPIYYYEGDFVVGSDGKGKTIVPNAWKMH